MVRMAETGRRSRRPGCLNLLLAALTVVALLYIGFLVLPPVRSVARTVALVPELVNLPIRPLGLFSAEPERTTTTYGRPADRLDIYVPAGGHAPRSLPAVVLALGVHPEDLDHPDIVRVAGAISRLGVVVGVPDSSALRDLRVTPAEPEHLADAALVLAARPEVDPRRLGLAGFSAGASMALLAAADPRLAQLRFVSDFGGYADAEVLLVDVATRSMLLGDQVHPWDPDPGIRRDVALLLARAIEPAVERQELEPLLTSIAAAEERPARDPTLEAGLSGDARVAYLLFTAPDRSSATTVLAEFSPRLRTDLRGISPVAASDGIHGQVFVLHGIGDRAIPVSHAYALAARLPRGVLSKMTLFGRFEHGQPGRDGLGAEDAGDILELSLYLHAIVAAATE